MRLRAGAVALLAAGIPSLLAAQEKTKETPAPAAPPAVVAPAASDTNAVDRIPLAELKKLLEAKKVLVVDVRGADAYKMSHIPGSVSAPLGEMEKHVAELKSAKKPIVTYCS
jgi:3-mercaptopyruvate sulfurtransferase SseA